MLAKSVWVKWMEDEEERTETGGKRKEPEERNAPEDTHRVEECRSGSKRAVPAGQRELDGHGVDDTRWVRWKVGEMKLILRPGRHAGGGGVSSLPGLMRYKNGMLNEEKRNRGRRNRTIPLPGPKTSRAHPCPQGAATDHNTSGSEREPVSRYLSPSAVERALPHYTDADDSRAVTVTLSRTAGVGRERGTQRIVCGDPHGTFEDACT
ncbi:hypothetical protein B0H13DRAFT_1932073 [Mycena leptocephala]|nr:hypothetical protein B0H13DRAFT_1932073 [Mycena leptocephala]